MAALEEDQYGKNLDYLFDKKQKYVNKFRNHVRCDECIFSENRSDLPDNFIHCTKYPYMNCLRDCYCKAGIKRK